MKQKGNRGTVGFLVIGCVVGAAVCIESGVASAEPTEGRTTKLEQADGGSAEQVYRYTVRGRIRQLPSSPSGEVFIRHEPIPEYVNEEGKVVGMHAMTMPFWIGEGVSLEGIQVNDEVEFQLESQWRPKPIDRIVSIKKVG